MGPGCAIDWLLGQLGARCEAGAGKEVDVRPARALHARWAIGGAVGCDF